MSDNGLTPGTLIDKRYEIVSTLGQGGMGAVYVANDTKLGNRVALKIAEASGQAYDEFAQRFKREAKIGNKLGRETGLVRAFDWGKLGDGRSLFLAMDLIPDASPLKLTAEDPTERLAALREAAQLVAKVHQHRVVHRDLKPENFLQDPAGNVYLTDFGLAKNLDAADDGGSATLTKSHIGMGSPYYMPPEQFEDTRSVDERADVYALGVMLFAALTQRFPYGGNSAAEVFKLQLKVQTGAAKPPAPRDLEPGAPPALDALCREALELDPDLRSISAQTFAERLDVHLGARVSPPSRPSPRQGPSKRRPRPPTSDPAPPVEPSASSPELDRLLDKARGACNYSGRLDRLVTLLCLPTFGTALGVGLLTEWYWGLGTLVGLIVPATLVMFLPRQRALTRELAACFQGLLEADPELGQLPPQRVLAWVAQLPDLLLQEALKSSLRGGARNRH